MTLIESLLYFLKHGSKTVPTPDSHCPSCWDHESYEMQFRNEVVKKKIDLHTIDKNLGWIQAYAAKNLEGIEFTSYEQDARCPFCGKTRKD